MKINRRNFISGTVATAVMGGVGNTALAKTLSPDNYVIKNSIEPDGLNPPGIKVAGIKMVPVVNGKYKVWTKRVGKGSVKVLLLHGGPGLGHDYLEVMESFLPEAGIEMYYYDQLGTYNSDQPEDSSLWNIPRYVEEVEEVRRGLGLDNFVLYGHSFGGLLAMEYALKYQQHLRGLVISNMAASSASYLKRTAAIKESLAPGLRDRLNKLEADKAYDSPEYEKIMMDELYPMVICRIKPWPEPILRSVKQMNAKIYEQIQGKSEFEVTGNMKNWDIWNRLHEIKTKTLSMGAKYDEMDSEDMKRIASLIPNASVHICNNGSHMSFYDDQQSYFDALLKFLHSV
jgi:proline iminopeptidase